MENTFFLARVMGLALIIGGMSLLFYYKDMKKVMSDLQNNYFLQAWTKGSYIGHKTLQLAFDEIAKWRPNG